MVEQGLGIDYRALYRAQAAGRRGQLRRRHKRWVERVGREPEDDELEPLTWAVL